MQHLHSTFFLLCVCLQGRIVCVSVSKAGLQLGPSEAVFTGQARCLNIDPVIIESSMGEEVG